MGKRTIKKNSEAALRQEVLKNLSTEALLASLEKLKEINDNVISMVNDKLKDFHNKLNDQHARIERLESRVEKGVTDDDSGPDASGGGTEDSN